MAAAVQRKAIEDELQRFTLRVTRRTVPIIFSTMLVQASERRSSAGIPLGAKDAREMSRALLNFVKRDCRE